MLQTEARVDSIVFFLEHQANHGLVRLADADCRDRTSARIARSGEALRFPIARKRRRAAIGLKRMNGASHRTSIPTTRWS